MACDVGRLHCGPLNGTPLIRISLTYSGQATPENSIKNRTSINLSSFFSGVLLE